ncbi:MAG: hypothetical protein VST71_01875 [Nitrospirota bacterium]|nr:hypothetical protein [Nitrospirota bacterium]
MRFVFGVIISLAVLVTWPVVAPASEGEKGDNGDEIPVISASLSVEQINQSDINGSGASIGYTEISAGLKWQFLLLDIDHRKYDWEKSEYFGSDQGKDPWEILTRIAPGLQYYYKPNEKWGVWPKFVAIAGFEDDISAKSWTYNPQIVGFYMPTQQLTLYGGVGMLYHPVDSIVYPALGVAWNMKSEEGLSGAVGFPETMLRYGFNKRVALKTEFQWDIRFYRLAEDNNLAPGGFVEIEDTTCTIQLEHKPFKGLTLSLGIRRYFGRELTVFDHTENELTTNDVSDSWAYLLGIDYQF